MKTSLFFRGWGVGRHGIRADAESGGKVKAAGIALHSRGLLCYTVD